MSLLAETPDAPPAHVRDLPPVAECKQCNCSISGGVSDSLLRQFQAFHDHGDAS